MSTLAFQRWRSRKQSKVWLSFRMEQIKQEVIFVICKSSSQHLVDTRTHTHTQMHTHTQTTNTCTRTNTRLACYDYSILLLGSGRECTDLTGLKSLKSRQTSQKPMPVPYAERSRAMPTYLQVRELNEECVL